MVADNERYCISIATSKKV